MRHATLVAGPRNHISTFRRDGTWSLNWYRDERPFLRFEASGRTTLLQAHVQWTGDCETGLQLGLAARLFSVYVTLPRLSALFKRWMGYGRREVQIAWCEDWTFRAEIASDPHSWSRSDPWWMHWRVCFKDLLLGKLNTRREVVETVGAVLHMPETADYPARDYPAKVSRYRVHHTRSRARALSWDGYEVSVEGGVPHPGKGTMAHNCGEDALFSMSTTRAGSLEGALDAFREAVLDSRSRYPL